MSLIVLIGAQAVGKMTVGKELEKRIDGKLLFNHQTIDLFANYLGYNHHTFSLSDSTRKELFKAFVANKGNNTTESIIFTVLVAFNQASDIDFLKEIANTFLEEDEDVYFIELVSNISVRLERNKQESRLLAKPSKRDLVFSENEVLTSYEKHQLESKGNELSALFEPLGIHCLKIDNTSLSPESVSEIIIEKFELKSKIIKMADNDVLLDVLEKFTSSYINLTDKEAVDPDGKKLPPLTNLGMGYVFEELIRKFNEDNNEEAGEHFTPREVIDLMTHIIFDPIKDNLPPVMTIYDPACGSGGMLTESQNFIKDEDGEIKAKGDVLLYGKEVNPETYAICKSDMMIKGNNPENIKYGSTLSVDDFAGIKFDFMLSNPPYGKSWASEQKYIKDGKDVIDSRFIVNLADYWGNRSDVDATPRSSDGQLLFLMEMVGKMKPSSSNGIGSRIASVHNGSSLFTGDAGGGESNIRRYIIENDLLDAIIQLPNNLFYNTGITTYIWLL